METTSSLDQLCVSSLLQYASWPVSVLYGTLPASASTDTSVFVITHLIPRSTINVLLYSLLPDYGCAVSLLTCLTWLVDGGIMTSTTSLWCAPMIIEEPIMAPPYFSSVSDLGCPGLSQFTRTYVFFSLFGKNERLWKNLSLVKRW